jgi:oligopeptide transport system substrate-binding protein
VVTWSQDKRNEEAKKLLAEAGYTADKPLTFNLLYNTSDLHKKLAIAVASIWKKNLGANVKLENQEWKTFLDNRQGTFDVARAGWCADYNEPTSFLNTMLSDSSNNTHYKSPAFDKIIAETLQTNDDAKRTDLYAQAEQQLDKDSAIVPVFYYVNARLVKPWVVAIPVKTRWIISTLKIFILSNINGNVGQATLAPPCLISSHS